MQYANFHLRNDTHVQVRNFHNFTCNVRLKRDSDDYIKANRFQELRETIKVISLWKYQKANRIKML
jgi:hypothetical protein